MDDLTKFPFLDVLKPEVITDEEFTSRHARATGKSFRQVLRALCKTSEKDNSVNFFMSNTRPHRDHAFRLACAVCEVLNVGTINKSQKKITFPNGGVLEFITDRDADRIRGKRAQTLVVDGY